MKFDVKDLKSWNNRHDVKVGDEGYVSRDLNTLQDDLKSGIAQIRIICHVGDDDVYCFSCKAFGATRNYGFFLPADAVKEDEKKYRPFKDLYEFYQFLSFNSHITEEDFTPEMLLGLYFKYREKEAPRFARTIVINRIDFDLADNPCAPSIEGRNLGLWFDFSEIMNDEGEWRPFGVQVND